MSKVFILSFLLISRFAYAMDELPRHVDWTTRTVHARLLAESSKEPMQNGLRFIASLDITSIDRKSLINAEIESISIRDAQIRLQFRDFFLDGTWDSESSGLNGLVVYFRLKNDREDLQPYAFLPLFFNTVDDDLYLYYDINKKYNNTDLAWTRLVFFQKLE